MFDETYVSESQTVLEGSGVRIFVDIVLDTWGGETFQYRASNSNIFTVCAKVTLISDAQTSGHSMGSIFRLSGGETSDIGYVVSPANFSVSARIWAQQANGQCGYPPN